MKIAYIVPYIPNKIRTRPFNLVSSLSELGHEVDVFTIGSSKADQLDAELLKTRCRNVFYQHQSVWFSLLNSVLAVPSSKPLQSVYSWHPKLAAQLKTRLASNGTHSAYDVVHVEHLRGSRYGEYIKSQFPTLPVVWDSVDCISHLFQQAAGQSKSLFGKLMTRFELKRTSKTEGRLLGCFDRVLVTSQMDKNALLETLSHGMKVAPITVLSNGVDQDYFHVNPELERDSDMLVFSGKMSYHANISMALYLIQEIMPRLWEKRPSVRLVIVGKDPPAELRKLADSSRIQVTGTVEDIRPFLWKATAAVVPLVYGAGIQNKILEAMATGTAVITNSKVLTSLAVMPGEELLVADSAEEFGECALKLIENPVLRNTVGEAGSQYVKKHHNWREISQELVNIYHQVLPVASGQTL